MKDIELSYKVGNLKMNYFQKSIMLCGHYCLSRINLKYVANFALTQTHTINKK